MLITQTSRLALRELEAGDAGFILELLNDPDWIRFIGDRGIRDEAGARGYIDERARAMYARDGFGLWRVALRDDDTPLGLCGLIRRPTLANVDLGFAFLPAARGQGYAFEAARACLDLARQRFGLARVVAITDPANARSIGLLERLGFRREAEVTLAGDDGPVLLFAHD